MQADSVKSRQTMDALGKDLAGLSVGGGRRHGHLTVFPVFRVTSSGGRDLEYETLEDAIRQEQIVITEQPTAHVPELLLVNRGPRMVLALDGQEVLGGRQNRVLNATVLAAAASQIVLPVSCVERCRWNSSQSQTFSSGETIYASLRQKKLLTGHRSLRTEGQHGADQGEIWQDIGQHHDASRSRSKTQAMNDLYKGAGRKLSACETALPYVDGAVGLLVAQNGLMAGGDIFDQPRTAESNWKRLIRSYAFDVLRPGTSPPVHVERAQRVFGRTLQSKAQVFASPGLGFDVRLEGSGILGSALIYEDRLVHLNVFRTH